MDGVQVAALSKGMRIEADSHQPKIGAVVGVVMSIKDRAPEDLKEIRVQIKPDDAEALWVKPEWIKRVLVGEAKVYAEPDAAREATVRNTTKQMFDNPLLGLIGAMDDQSRRRPSGSFIEDMEAQGQREFAGQTTKLPKEGSDNPAWAKMGVIFKGVVEGDPIWRHVEMPMGWKIVADKGHSMWNSLRDDQGRERGAMFYKAAFYDRSCNIHPKTRYQISRESKVKDDYDSPERWTVLDTSSGKVLHTSDWLARPEKYTAEHSNTWDGMYKEIQKWLTEHRPLWQDASAYWGWD